jgi:vacuolar-type H+-ATPase subunit H
VENIRQKVEKVLNAEKDAKSTLEKAQDEKNIILRDAEKKVKSLKKSALSKADDIISEYKVNFGKETETEINVVLEKMKEDIKKIENLGAKNISNADSFIIKSIVE